MTWLALFFWTINGRRTLENIYKKCRCETGVAASAGTRLARPVGCLSKLCSCYTSWRVSGASENCKSQGSSISEPGARAWITWQRRPETCARLWSGLSGSGYPRYWRTCTSSAWRTHTGGPAGTRSPPCSSSSSGTIRSAAASRCSLDCTTVCCSYATFALQTAVRESITTLFSAWFKHSQVKYLIRI